MQLTGTNRSRGLIRASCAVASPTDDSPSNPENRNQELDVRTDQGPAARPDRLARPRVLTAWWLQRGGRTRSHPELGRENPQRRWYCMVTCGRVGRRQAFKTRFRGQMSGIRDQRTGIREQKPSGRDGGSIHGEERTACRSLYSVLWHLFSDPCLLIPGLPRGGAVR